jgi:hypothetical protein
MLSSGIFPVFFYSSRNGLGRTSSKINKFAKIELVVLMKSRYRVIETNIDIWNKQFMFQSPLKVPNHEIFDLCFFAEIKPE